MFVKKCCSPSWKPAQHGDCSAPEGQKSHITVAGLSAEFVSRASSLPANPAGLCFQLGMDDVKCVSLGLHEYA